MEFLEITTCSKLQVHKTQLIFVLKGIPNQNSILKINIACFNTNFFSLYYEPWHIWNPDIFIIRGIFRALEYSKVRRYVHDMSTFDVFIRLFLIYSRRLQDSCHRGKLPPPPNLNLALKLTLTLTEGGNFLRGKLSGYHSKNGLTYFSTWENFLP